MPNLSDAGATCSVGRHENETPQPSLASLSFDPPSADDGIPEAPPCPAERDDTPPPQQAGARAPSPDVKNAPPCSAEREHEPAPQQLESGDEPPPQLLAGAYGVLFEQMAAVCAHATTSSTVI